VLSRVFDKPLAIMSTSSYRAEGGTLQGRLDMAKYITMPKGELAGRVLLVDDLSDSGVTLRAVVDRLRGMPSIQWAIVDHPIASLKEDELREASIDLDQITRGNINPFKATLTISKNAEKFLQYPPPMYDMDGEPIMQDPIGEVPRAAFPQLLRVDLVFTPNRHMVLEYTVRVRDVRHDLIHELGVTALTDPTAMGQLQPFEPMAYPSSPRAGLDAVLWARGTRPTPPDHVSPRALPRQPQPARPSRNAPHGNASAGGLIRAERKAPVDTTSRSRLAANRRRLAAL